MIKPSRFALEKLNIHPGYTVGYGSRTTTSSSSMPRSPRCMARVCRCAWPMTAEQFQSGIKRHPFDIRYQLAVDRNDLGFRIFRADMSADGGGRANYSASVAAVGATAAQSIYYMPQNDLAVTAYHSRGVEAGSMRGYGTLQTMAATEMMVDEIAGRLGVDAIDLRRRNALRSGMKNTQGAVPAGALRLHEILDKAAAHEVWKDRDARRSASTRRTRTTGMGSASPFARRTSAPAPRRRWRIEFSADGRISLRHIGTEIGTGMSTSQAFVVGDFSASGGRGEDRRDRMARAAAHHQGQSLPDEPGRAGRRATRSALGRQAGLAVVGDQLGVLFQPRHPRSRARTATTAGRRPWRCGAAVRSAARPIPMVRRENAVWVDGQLTGNGLAPIPFAELAKKAHEMGLVTGVSVHGFNRWSWAEADFVIDGVRERLPLDAMAVKYGDGAPGVKKAMMNSAGFHLLDRQNPAYPATQLNNAMVTYSPVATWSS